MAKRGPKPKRAAKRDVGVLWAGFRIPDELEAETRAAFDQLVETLRALGILDKTDPRIVLATVRTQALIDKAHAEIENEGLTLCAANGTTMPHPMISALNSLTMRLRGLLNDMGLTPASSKLTAPTKAEKKANPWIGLLDVG